jgi:choloylglycine hydrolase
LTNAPEFPWHLSNLRNYVGLKPQAWAPIKVGDLEVAPLGAGSGMIGLPGDFSPTSRFVRAVALRNTVRPLVDGEDAILEAFRILNNFDLPLGAVDAPGKDIMGSTIWTSAMDTKALRYYYRTQYNSRLRVVDMKSIDFNNDKIVYVPMDTEKRQDYQQVIIP